MDREDKLNSIFEFCLKLFLFLSPVFYFGDLKQSFAQELFFIFSSFGLFTLSIGLKPRREFSNIWFSLFLFWSLLSIFLHGVTTAEISRLSWPVFAISSEGFLPVLAGFLLFRTVYCYVNKPERFLKPIILACIINLIFASFQSGGINLIYTHRSTICGMMGLSSQLGSYSAMIFPIAGFINPLLAILPFVCLLLAESFSPILALASAFLIYVVFSARIRFKPFSLFLIIVAVGGGICFITAHWHTFLVKIARRWAMWQPLIKAIIERPFIGCGWRNYISIISDFGTYASSRPHQDWGHIACEIGAAGVIFIAGYLSNLGKRFKRAVKDKLAWALGISVLVILINMTFQTTIRYANIAGTFFPFLAFLEIQLYESKSQA